MCYIKFINIQIRKIKKKCKNYRKTQKSMHNFIINLKNFKKLKKKRICSASFFVLFLFIIFIHATILVFLSATAWAQIVSSYM